jgi:Domain of unknown function (DUF4188)
MSRSVHPGRFTAEIDGEFVVFLIGMRFNKLWKVHKWLPVLRAMPTMLAELARYPEKGLLDARTNVSGRTVTVIQYWRSFEQLERFARDQDDPHLEAWRAFNRSVGTNGDVGVYHETFRVAPGAYECVYVNMPAYGLAEAGHHVPVAKRGESARERITADA